MSDSYKSPTFTIMSPASKPLGRLLAFPLSCDNGHHAGAPRAARIGSGAAIVQRVIAVVGNARVSLQGASVTLMSAEIAGLGKLRSFSLVIS